MEHLTSQAALAYAQLTPSAKTLVTGDDLRWIRRIAEGGDVTKGIPEKILRRIQALNANLKVLPPEHISCLAGDISDLRLDLERSLRHGKEWY